MDAQHPFVALLLAMMLATEGVSGLPGACSALYNAKAGDTCASIAASAGISISEFLRDNPSVTQCDDLTAGTSYCVDPAEARPLKTSADGQCGREYTCAGSAFGECCSPHGW